ncbi:hypothetical protein H5410_046092 [Solanum commersonii]|uniref:Uncharacterized protein n=1 Tax=Solanum commersonii TaxID=4109 RepID=A0A9J5XD61_SOLCO|nr:hypothetical protein H5410_046092 [Solanum commersonii]
MEGQSLQRDAMARAKGPLLRFQSTTPAARERPLTSKMHSRPNLSSALAANPPKADSVSAPASLVAQCH